MSKDIEKHDRRVIGSGDIISLANRNKDAADKRPVKAINDTALLVLNTASSLSVLLVAFVSNISFTQNWHQLLAMVIAAIPIITQCVISIAMVCYGLFIKFYRNRFYRVSAPPNVQGNQRRPLNLTAISATPLPGVWLTQLLEILPGTWLYRVFKRSSMKTSPPVVIEMPMKDSTRWLLSFGGSNPQKDECLELTESQCFWLEQQIMNIDPMLLEHAKKLQAMSQTRQGRMSPSELQEIGCSFAEAIKGGVSSRHQGSNPINETGRDHL